MRNYRGRIEIKQGKFAYDQIDEARAAGVVLVKKLRRRWTPPYYCYHLKKGGHLAAVRRHLANQYFARLDIEDFFQSISKSMIIRALKKARFSFIDAADAAVMSTIRIGDRFVLPYGFVQSSLLATLVLAKSPVHPLILDLQRKGITITVYVDDIIISANSLAEVQNAFDELTASLAAAKFRVNARKAIPPATRTEAFNLVVEQGGMEVVEDRMEKFRRVVLQDPISQSARQSILYVAQVNVDQGVALAGVGFGFGAAQDFGE